jgi:hypothetical protein
VNLLDVVERRGPSMAITRSSLLDLDNAAATVGTSVSCTYGLSYYSTNIVQAGAGAAAGARIGSRHWGRRPSACMVGVTEMAQHSRVSSRRR